MTRLIVFLGGLAVAAATSVAHAQSWSVGVGVGFGDPGYYAPPPGYYYAPPPVYYGPPPGYLYQAPPEVYAPPPLVVHSSVSPDAVFDNLERAGYRDFGPMAFRDGVYKLNAIDRRGRYVALEVSALDGQVEREIVIGGAERRAPRAAARAPSRAPHESGGDPLVVY